MRQWLHRVGLYFGIAEPTEDERREQEAAEDQLLARPASRLVLDAVRDGALSGVIFGAAYGLLVGTSLAGAAIRGVLFGVAMGAVSLWRMRSDRQRAAERST